MWRFDLSDEQWTEIQMNGTLPTDRHNHTAVVFGDCMYVFGGSGAAYFGDFFQFDFKTSTWTELHVPGGIHKL
jgi:N-acetylneuraminic acid mutarotase